MRVYSISFLAINQLFCINYVRCIVGVYLLLCASPLYANTKTDEQIVTITIPIIVGVDCNYYAQYINQLSSVPFLLEDVTFESDVFIQPGEFDYLVDLHRGSFISSGDLKKAIWYLSKKNKFSEVVLQIMPGAYGKRLFFYLFGMWTFTLLKVCGILTNKQRYYQYYCMESNDPFDMQKHNNSTEKMIDADKKRGYFDTHITSSFSRNVQEKTVAVTITINNGKRFVIDEVRLNMCADECASDDELLFLKRRLYRKFFKWLPNCSYDRKTLDQVAYSVKDYLAKQGFLHVTINLDEIIDRKRESVQLMWNIHLHHKRLFIFWGNRFFSEMQLLDNILLFGRSAWLVPASILAEEIERAYRDKGFWNVAIESQEEDGRYFFIIKEGARVSIEEVVLQNIQHGDQHMLVKKNFSTVLKRKYFNQDDVRQALDACVDWHIQRGFLDARMLDYTFIPCEKKHTYKLVVTLEQGELYHLENIEIPGFEQYLTAGPFHYLLKSKEPILFNATIINEQRSWLLRTLHRKGYKNARVKSELIKGAKNSITIRWNIDLRITRMRFGKTIVLGGGTFPFEYLLRELSYNRGGLWDQDKLKQSFLRIKKLQVFDSINLYPDSIVDENNEQAIILKIQKDDHFELRVRAGLELQHIQKYQTFGGITYKLGGAFMVKNPTNVGDLFRIDTDFTRVHREIVAQYRRPWLLGLPLSSLFQGYSIMYDQPGFIGSKKNIYTVIQHGVLLGLEKKSLYADTGLNIGIELMQTKINNDSPSMQQFVSQLSRAINFDPLLVDKKILFFFIQPNIFIDYLDHKLNPTRGLYTLLSMKGMFPIHQSNAYFIKFLAEQAFFIPLKKMVGAIRIRFGHIFHRNFSAIMPSERFYLGGSHSLRGYESDLTPPLGTFIDIDGTRNIVPRGGKSMVNINIECRFPLIENLGGAFFHDIGMLSGDNFADFKSENILAATGFGIRFYTPVGPLRFDIGFKWRKTDPLNRSYAWFLTLGHSF